MKKKLIFAGIVIVVFILMFFAWHYFNQEKTKGNISESNFENEKPNPININTKMMTDNFENGNPKNNNFMNFYLQYSSSVVRFGDETIIKINNNKLNFIKKENKRVVVDDEYYISDEKLKALIVFIESTDYFSLKDKYTDEECMDGAHQQMYISIKKYKSTVTKKMEHKVETECRSYAEAISVSEIKKKLYELIENLNPVKTGTNFTTDMTYCEKDYDCIISNNCCGCTSRNRYFQPKVEIDCSVVECTDYHDEKDCLAVDSICVENVCKVLKNFETFFLKKVAKKRVMVNVVYF